MKKLIVIFALLMAGCCPLQQSIASAVNAGVSAAAETEGLPDDAADDLRVAQGVAELGEGAADACVEGDGWSQWILFALEATRGLVEHFTGASDAEAGDPPPELLEAVELLEAQAAP